MTWDCNGNYYKLFKSSITKNYYLYQLTKNIFDLLYNKHVTDIKAPQCFGINNKYPCDPEWVNLLLIFYVHLIQGR